MKKLILGFGTNQTHESLEVFLRSARAVWARDQADIAVLTNSIKGLEALLDETDAIAVSTTNNYRPSTSKYAKLWNRVYLHTLRLIAGGPKTRTPELYEAYLSMLETWHHPQLARWFAYRRVLELMHQYSHVVLADTRDVVFQADVFDRIDPDRVNLCEDGESFTPESWNGRWYIQAYGRAAFDQIASRQPICIGTVIAEMSALRRVNQRFTDRIAASPFGKIEQAIFNDMVLKGEFGDDITICKNYAPVGTLAGGDDLVAASIEVKPDGVICDSNGEVLPIVHMYDRHPSTHQPTLDRFANPVA